jgi:signal peptide peptidase SppA
LTPGESFFTLFGMGTALSGFTRNLYTAMVDPKITAIVVIADSPGGSIRGVPEAAAAMRRVREVKPVVAAVTGMAASAAYWIVSNASVIESTPSGSVGGIGILTERVSVVKQLAQDGIDVTVVSAGRYKSEGHPATPMSADEQKALQQRVDAANTSMGNDIAAGRHVSPSIALGKSYGEGRLLDAVPALKVGMIDRVSLLNDTVARTLANPAALTALYEGRVERARSTSERLRRDQVRGEIATYRDQLQASVRRVTLR